ncbi:MAG: FHA domain-containing protein, partial [Thermanaerothrix sp.]|nr:FHA domain-containing protein [Thermanaerothrix sp.]
MSPSFQLYMRTGPTPGERFPLEKDEIWLGRDPANDIVIADPEISRRHARFLLRGSTYLVEDLGSTNGTLVNGEMITAPQPLSHGDVIEFGEHTSLVFEVTKTAIDETVAVFRDEMTESPFPGPEREEPTSASSSL